MYPKLLKKTSISEYQPAAWTGKNESGLHPIGNRVLVLPDQAATQSSGGIHLSDDLVERHQMAAESGVLIAAGEGTFIWNSDKATPFAGRKPQPGERVCIEKYAGQLVRGDDGFMYRLMDDVCVGGILEEEKTK